MADTPDPAAEGGGQDEPTPGELASRMDGLESKLDVILGKLGGAEHDAREAAGERTEERLDRPTSVADEIRRQLADAKKATDEEARNRSTSDRLARLEAMTEQQPEAPVRRVEKFMWGAR